MKTSKALLVMVLGTATSVMAAPPAQTPSASHAVDTNAIPSRLMSMQPAAKGKIEFQRAGNMSSRPWPEIVGWHPGTSQFPDGQNQEPQLTLFSVSFGPGTHHPAATSGRRTPP